MERGKHLDIWRKGVPAEQLAGGKTKVVVASLVYLRSVKDIRAGAIEVRRRSEREGQRDTGARSCKAL